MSSPADLVTSDVATQALAAGNFILNPAQSVHLPRVITSCSREMVRFMNRPIILTAYDEIIAPEGGRQDRGEPASAKLSYFPVHNPVVRTGRTQIVLLTNTDTATNQEAYAGFTFTGAIDYNDFVYTGLTLTRTASGTVDEQTLTWTLASPYTTIQSLAASINALGGGWLATLRVSGVNPDPTLLPAAWLVGAREPKNAFSPGVSLDAFIQPASRYDLDRSNGIMRFYGGGGFGGLNGGVYGGGFGDPWGGSWDGDNDTGGQSGWNQYRVKYQAGFATVPEDLQEICCELVKATFERLNTDTALQSESAKDYSYTVKEAWKTLPDWAIQALNMYKDFGC